MVLSKALTLFVAIIFCIGGRTAQAETLSIQGSTTVFPVVQILVEEYEEINPAFRASIGGGGSGVGVSLLLDGTIDVALSSRPLSQGEWRRAEEVGIDVKEVIIGYDALAVVVHPENPLEDITREELAGIYTGEITYWEELGWTEGGWIMPISREFASGSFEVFETLVLREEFIRPDGLMLVSSLTVLNEVRGSPACIAYLGLPYLGEGVRILSVNGALPTHENVGSGEYPLARPLYLYLEGPAEGALADFIEFTLGEEGRRIIEKEGFVP